MTKEEPEVEAICFNCNQFFPASMDEPSEFGICLDDEEFEPFLDELLVHSDYSPCQDLVDRKQFSGEQEACADFEEIEFIEIDDSSSFGRELMRLRETGQLDPESFENAMLEEKLRNIDWSTMPVDQYISKLKHSDPEKQREAISSLSAMSSLGNSEAFKVLFQFFKKLPSPETIEEVHFKRDLLRSMERSETKSILMPCLIDELYRTPSNNTTRQWISDIFRFLEYVPLSEVRGPLEKMLRHRRFSYRLKQKMKKILAQRDYDELWSDP